MPGGYRQILGGAEKSKSWRSQLAMTWRGGSWIGRKVANGGRGEI